MTELIIELILLILFLVLVFMDAPMRFIFEAGIVYLAAVIRHSKGGGGR